MSPDTPLQIPPAAPQASLTQLTRKIIRDLRQKLAQGKWQPGDSLPTVRELAKTYAVNQNTIARAYRALERKGLLIIRRKRGTSIASLKETKTMPQQSKWVIEQDALKLMTDAKLAGWAEEDLFRLIRAHSKLFWPT